MADPRRTTPEPGDRAPGIDARGARQLDAPPSARYTTPGSDDAANVATASALPRPLVSAAVVALAGALLLVLVGAVFASTVGLVFVAGVSGAGIGLVLARAAVPRDPALRAVPRRTLAWVGVGLSLVAVAIAALATWVIARGEGGTLGVIDYLLETFGPFVPAEAVIASLAAWWGASTGPVQS